MTIAVLDKDGNPVTISTIDDLLAIIGAAVTSPSANTVQDRLKALATALATNHADEAALHSDIATTLAGLIASGNTSLAALLTAIGSAALDRGVGVAGANTLRVSSVLDLAHSTGLNTNGRTSPTNGAPVTPVACAAFLDCPANASTHLIKNGAGAAGDYLEVLTCIVSTPATSLVQIKDGAAGSAHDVLPNNVAAGVGTYQIALGYRATAADGWTVVCGAGVKVLAGGDF